MAQQQVQREVVAFAIELERQIPKVEKNLALSLELLSGGRATTERLARSLAEDIRRAEGGHRPLEETFVPLLLKLAGLL